MSSSRANNHRQTDRQSYKTRYRETPPKVRVENNFFFKSLVYIKFDLGAARLLKHFTRRKLILFLVSTGLLLLCLGSILLVLYLLYQNENSHIRPMIVIGKTVTHVVLGSSITHHDLPIINKHDQM